MTIENSNPNAQGPQTVADGQAQAQPPVQPQSGASQFEGIEKRINELTASWRAAERRAEEQASLNQQLLMQMASGQQAPRYEQQAQPQLDIDPEQRKVVEALMAPQLAQLKQQQAQFLVQSMTQQLESVVQGQHPEVAKRTREIFSDAVTKGAHLNGFNPAQALTWARGQLVDVLIADAQKGRQVAQTQQFQAATNQGLPVQSAVAPTSQGQQVAAPDFDDDPEAASAYYAQRLGNKTF